MINSFRNKQTEKIWNGIGTKKLPTDVQERARRKLRMIDSAATLDDLKIPPGNRLEALHGDRAGQYSIRVNDQFRICFLWQSNNADGVEFTDYHD
jgi:proteic killer suppression protein